MYHWFTKTYPRDVFELAAQRAMLLLPAPATDGDDVTARGGGGSSGVDDVIPPWLLADDVSGFAALAVTLSAMRLVSSP